MAKILFINPVIRQNDNPAHVPYGMAQLVALAIKAGHQVQVFDANAWRPSDADMREVISADSWDVIAIGGLITTYGYIKKTVACARKIDKKAVIIAGGGFLTPIPYEIMTFIPEIDIGIIGEAYITLLEILKKIDDKDRDWAGVKGIIFRKPSGELYLNQERPLLEDVDSLPFPAWHIFPLDIYFKNSSLLLSEEAMLSKRHLGIMASYGCPFKCKYCFHLGLSGELATSESNGKKQINITSKRIIRRHSPEYVVELVKYLKKRFRVDFVSFYDENFSNLARNERWFGDFSRRWISSGLQPECSRNGVAHDPKKCRGIHWGTTAHAALVNPDILKKFKRLGCTHLDYGLESFSDNILKSICKCATMKDNENAVKMTIRSGIRPIPNQIIGFPDESLETIFANIDAWNRLGIQSYPFFATPYPGSDWYFEYKDRILEQYDGDLEAFLLDLGDATKVTAVISKRFSAVELLGLRELMVNRDINKLKQYQSKLAERR